MRRTWVRVLAVGGAALLAVWAASLFLPGLEELSWAAGTGSFVLAAVALALAWTPPKRTPTPMVQAPAPTPSASQVINRSGDVHGTTIQAGTIGPVTVHSPPAPANPPVPGWVEVALPVHQADARDLGAHEALPGPEGEALPPYVARDVDDELDRRLAAAVAAPRGGLVLVAGASTAGKTRALAAALARTLPERMLVAPPQDADLRPLPTWLQGQADRAPQGWVVWLDDLDRHLAASGLTPALVAELGRAGAVVAATIRRNQLQALRPSAAERRASDAEGAGYAVLKSPPVVVERRWSPTERERARASEDERLVRAADDERFGVAEHMAAGPHLQQAWESGPDSGYPRGYALVAAAVGVALAGVSSPLTREQIHAVHSAYLPTPPPLPEDSDRAWEWATRQRSGLAGLLVPADHDGRWRAFDYLTLPSPLPEAVWSTALDTAFAQDRLDVGLTAYHADRPDIAETAWRALAGEGETDAMNNLGLLLYEAGRVGEAESWLLKAIEGGDTGAMHILGVLLAEVGRKTEAEEWYRKAAEDGHTGAMYILGNLLYEADRKTEAVSWLLKAAEGGESGAIYILGVLLAEVGRKTEAEEWYRKASEDGESGAMYILGLMLYEAGRVGEAESWLLKAIEGGETDAMINLGNLLREVGRKTEAEEWYRKASEATEG